MGYSRCLQIRIWCGLYQPGSGKAEHTAAPGQVMPHWQGLPTTWNSSVPQAIALLAFFFPSFLPITTPAIATSYHYISSQFLPEGR